MKKVLIFLFCISLLLINKTKSSNQVYIPDEAIRFRIIANSNSFKDQEEKMLISTELKPLISSVISNNKNIAESRKKINENIPNFAKIVEKYTNNYNISYGNNYFPQKTYKNVNYKEGNYESLVITLGDGVGDNWWCVLFPPLCLLEAEENNINDVEYSFYIKDIIDNFS